MKESDQPQGGSGFSWFLHQGHELDRLAGRPIRALLVPHSGVRLHGPTMALDHPVMLSVKGRSAVKRE